MENLLDESKAETSYPASSTYAMAQSLTSGANELDTSRTSDFVQVELVSEPGECMVLRLGGFMQMIL